MYTKATDEDGPLPKRWKSSSSQTTNQQSWLNNNEIPIPQSQYNPLSEPSPLGLRLRKSPSLLELAQKRLNQGNTDKGDLPVENLEAGTKRDLRARDQARASGSIDKLKASHFPALLLRIGQWEYVSKHEGDLVAKCYFSKHKIVWEVLDGGLKKKFEINWADLVVLKANFADDGLGTLTIVLDKQPLFFKEINPQPRKHTQWRATSDFTDGEAITHRQHFLQCAPGMLDKHYEKLIQCDTRLNFLSQQQDTVLDFPYFTAKASIKDQDISGNSGFNLPEPYSFAHMASPSTFQICLLKTVESSSLGLIHQDMSKEGHSSNSVMHMDPEGQQKTSRNLPISDNVSCQENPKDMLENISQVLLSDSHLTAASDEKTLMSRVNSLCCLLQDYQNGQQDGNVLSAPDPNLIPQQNRNDGSTTDSNLMPENRTQEDDSICLSTKFLQDYPNGQQDGNGSSTPGSNPESNLMPENEAQREANGSGLNQESGLSRNDSFIDLVHQLPRITSLPKFLFDISENGEILK